MSNSLALTGPTSGETGVASTVFTVTANDITLLDVVTPAIAGGTVSPPTLSFDVGTSAQTFTVTPTSDGPHAVSITDTASETTTGSPITYTAIPPLVLAGGFYSVLLPFDDDPTSMPTTPTLEIEKGTSHDFRLQIYNRDASIPTVLFLATDTLSASVWAGDGQAALITPTVTWISATAATYQVTFNDADTASVPASLYQIVAKVSRFGRSALILPRGSQLEVLDAPGTSVCVDLVTQDYLNGQLAAGGMTLTTAEQQALPGLATTASDLIRRACGDRDFNQQAYDRIFPIQLDGSVSLPQIPVLKVSRVFSERNTGIIITNTDRATNQRATVEYTCSGDESVGITYTGITLTRTASGVDTPATLLFASNVTLAALATAVNGIGHGWSASVASGYELNGTAELIADDDAAQDCFSGASLDIWANELQGVKVNKRTGILDCASGQVLGIDGPRWGPGWEIFERDDRETYSKVRVVYTAGFVSIPTPIQQATVLTVQSMLSTLRTDPRLSSETDGAYSYVINTAFADYALPKAVIGMIFPWVLHRT